MVTGKPVSALTRSKIFIPSTSPGPRKLEPDVRLALSNEALKTSGTDRSSQISTRRLAIRIVISPGSITQGPAIKRQRSIAADLELADFDRVGRGHPSPPV